MFDAFLLRLPVKSINKPENVPPPPDVWEIRVLLSTTIHEIKELIWIHSEGNALSPPFLRIKMFDGPVSDSLALDSLLGLNEPPAYHNSIDAFSLIIDYTLFDSPAIPHRDPVPLYFDVLVSATLNGQRTTTVCRETLFSTVRSIKEQITDKFNLESSAFGLKVPNENVLDEELTLREVLGLDVPLPRTERLELQLAERGTLLLKIYELATGKHFSSIHVTNATTVQEVKNVASRFAGTPVHLVRLYCRAHIIAEPSVEEDKRAILDILQLGMASGEAFEVEYDVADRLTTLINGEEWTPTGTSYVEIENMNGAKKVVNQAALSTSTYEIQFQGTFLRLDSSECIMNDDEGYVLISPIGYSKLRNKWGNRVQMAHQRNRVLNNDMRHRVLQPNPTLQPHVMQPRQNGDVAEPVHRAHEADPVQLQEEMAERDQLRNIAGQRQTVFTRLIAAAMANRQNLRRMGINLFFMAVIGFDMLFLLTVPKYAALIVLFTILYSIFVRGRDISDWLDHWILGEGAPNTIPFRIVRFISMSIRAGYNMYHFNFDRFYNSVSNMAMGLIPSKEEYLEMAARRADSISYYALCVIREICGLILLFGATIIPTVENAYAEQDLTRRNQTRDRLISKMQTLIKDAEIRHDFQEVKAYIERNHGSLNEIYALQDSEALVKAYFTIIRTCGATPEDIVVLNRMAGEAAEARN